MIMIECLVIKAYKGTTKTKQTEIVQSLGAKKGEGISCVWHVMAKTAEDVKRIESALLNKVPYRKTIV